MRATSSLGRQKGERKWSEGENIHMLVIYRLIQIHKQRTELKRHLLGHGRKVGVCHIHQDKGKDQQSHEGGGVSFLVVIGLGSGPFTSGAGTGHRT